jgi:hypothetical protein
VLRGGTDGWLAVLCSQGDRPYPAPLASRTVSDDSDVEQGIRALVDESNDLIEPPEGGVLMETFRLSRATHQLIERGVEALEKIGRELKQYNGRQGRTDGTDS